MISCSASRDPVLLLKKVKSLDSVRSTPPPKVKLSTPDYLSQIPIPILTRMIAQWLDHDSSNALSLTSSHLRSVWLRTRRVHIHWNNGTDDYSDRFRYAATHSLPIRYTFPRTEEHLKEFKKLLLEFNPNGITLTINSIDVIPSLVQLIETHSDHAKRVGALDLSGLSYDQNTKKVINTLVARLPSLVSLKRLSFGNICFRAPLVLPNGLSGLQYLAFRKVSSLLTLPNDLSALESLSFRMVFIHLMLPNGLSNLKILTFQRVWVALTLPGDLHNLQGITAENVFLNAKLTISANLKNFFSKELPFYHEIKWI